MSKKKNKRHESGIENVEEALTRTEQYIEENKKSLTIIVTVIVAVVGVYLAYKKFYLAPKELEAQSQIYRAQQYFAKDSFNLALHGDGNALGFLDIIDDYGVTKTANLSQYYAGICYLRMGKYKDAIEHLKKFDSKDKLLSVISIGAIGDAYSELGNMDKAASFYEKAATKNKNKFTSPIYLKKAGLIYETQKDYKKALNAYESIKREYPNSDAGREIDKYIEEVKLKI